MGGWGGGGVGGGVGWGGGGGWGGVGWGRGGVGVGGGVVLVVGGCSAPMHLLFGAVYRSQGCQG